MNEEYYLSYYIHEDSEKSYSVIIKFYVKWSGKAVCGVSQWDKHLDKHFFFL